MSHLMLIGIQGSGKGTQARKILEKYPEYVLFEMGTELRKFAANGTPDGEYVRSFLEQGLKAPTEYIVKLTEKFLADNRDKKILIDGAIRSAEQNDALETVWGDFEVLWLDLNEETAVERLSGRRIDPVTNETFPASFTGDTNPKTGNTLVTRADDTPEAIRKRIAWSKGDTLPLIEVWKRHGHTIHHIDASQSEEDIFHYVENAINK
ncbi:MAG: nucleoside monophosphate kinase [Candidatus Gracilibacteria bacterium]|nr:nucleoside monophosphate kinase [Candidatus Gracilibacteria bacterium]